MKTIGEPPSEVAAGYGDDGTASEKLITDTGDSELNLPIHTVMSNEDLLIEILLRLPIISLLLFKVVSKHWFSVITSPNFTSRLSRIPIMAPACGLFLRRRKSKLSMQFEYDFLSLNSRFPSKRSITTLCFCSETVCKVILDSCNGLILFCDGYDPSKLYVCNPTINLSKMLPQHSLNICLGAIMAFDPTKSPHYKVIPPQLKHGVIQIQTYSSETNSWSVYGPRYPWEQFTCFSKAVYWYDAIHWLNVSGEMPLHAMLNVVDNTVTTTTLPRPFDKRLHRWDHKFFQSRGCLLLICKEFNHGRLYLCEMRNWNSGWFVKYFINIDDIIKNPFPNNGWRLDSCVWSYAFGEREEDSLMVINLCGKVVEYKPMLKTFRELLILDTISPDSSHEFISSFAYV